MSAITKARGSALGKVCRLVVAAERHGEQSITVAELQLALDGVDVEGLAVPRPCVVRNVGDEFTFAHVTSHTPRA
jgi:hypothetical protein